MISLDEIKERELYNLNTSKRVWESDPRGLNNYHVKAELERIARKLANFDEYIKEIVAEYSQSTMHTISRIGFTRFVSPECNTNFLELQENDPVAQYYDLPHVNTYGATVGIADQVVQSLYESYGYTDKLPTKKEINLMSAQQAELDPSSVEYIELERKIVLAKKHRGEQTRYFRTDAAVNAIFDEQINRVLQEQALNQGAGLNI